VVKLIQARRDKPREVPDLQLPLRWADDRRLQRRIDPEVKKLPLIHAESRGLPHRQMDNSLVNVVAIIGVVTYRRAVVILIIAG
jgi:hypothetical protein